MDLFIHLNYVGYIKNFNKYAFDIVKVEILNVNVTLSNTKK